MSVATVCIRLAGSWEPAAIAKQMVIAQATSIARWLVGRQEQTTSGQTGSAASVWLKVAGKGVATAEPSTREQVTATSVNVVCIAEMVSVEKGMLGRYVAQMQNVGML